MAPPLPYCGGRPYPPQCSPARPSSACCYSCPSRCCSASRMLSAAICTFSASFAAAARRSQPCVHQCAERQVLLLVCHERHGPPRSRQHASPAAPAPCVGDGQGSGLGLLGVGTHKEAVLQGPVPVRRVVRKRSPGCRPRQAAGPGCRVRPTSTRRGSPLRLYLRRRRCHSTSFCVKRDGRARLMGRDRPLFVV